MYRILAATTFEAVDGHVDLDYRDTEGWGPYGDGCGLSALLGDDTAGPMVFLSSFPPMEDEMKKGFAHAHESDNWRISVRGTTNMGRDAYGFGQFRFQDGGVPYPGDNVAWGPDGGFGLIMFADRRGFAIRPVKEKIAEVVGPQQAEIGKQLGIDMQHPCPGAPAIATTFGGTERGHLNGGFESADQWQEVSTGTRVAAALMGERTCGPVLLLSRCEAGATALPRRSVSTEVLHAVVDGSAVIGDDVLDAGRVRIDEADADADAVVAGPDGLSLVTIAADRRAITGDALVTAMVDADWAHRAGAVLDALRAELATA